MTIKVIERHRFSPNHWYRFLPRRIQYYLAYIGIKLGIIRRYGVLSVVVTHPDGSTSTAKGYNIIVDDGIKRIGDILAGKDMTKEFEDYE